MKKTIVLLTVLSGLFANAQNWSLTGNAGTTSGTNFIGTTDNQDLVFKTNNIERFKISNQTGFNVSYPGIGFNIFGGKAKFQIDEVTNAFTVFNAPWDYFPMRVDGENRIVYLEEDSLNDGRVVIGSKTLATCSDCNQYKLFVKDGIRTEKVKVDIAANNGWADYVFKKDYKLMPLKAVENFINENGHLPEVPTTEEAMKNGIELKEMNILLLKKIEELTLYTIEQQKRIEALEKRMK
ncbi:hypothetical protein [Chryseobacterium sp.]|uniref:hypothetical protein n=1 Tax=Chryseobacterium sp. TaxID=1871047 RepID=UPI002637A1D0|nr:hypothetical protein [Chryseobacterium sp.]